MNWKRYAMDFICRQCSNAIRIYLPKGMLVDNFCRIANCPICACGPNLERSCQFD